jgi:hypothetical protein
MKICRIIISFNYSTFNTNTSKSISVKYTFLLKRSYAKENQLSVAENIRLITSKKRLVYLINYIL